MATSPTVCGVCDLFNVEQKSTVWCNECDEGLCIDCESYHALCDEKSHHKMVPIVDSGRLLPFSKVKEVCKEHNKMNCFYCTTHNIALCEICLKNHDCYRAISRLKGDKHLRNPNSFEYIESVLTIITNNITKLKEKIRSNLTHTLEKKEEIKEGIDNARKKVNRLIDQLQETLLDELNYEMKKIQSQTDKEIESLTEMAKQVKKCEFSIDIVKKYTSDITDLKLYLSKEQVHSDVADIEKGMQRLIDNKMFNDFSLSLSNDQMIHNILRNEKFGRININRETTYIENEIYRSIEQRMIRRTNTHQPSNQINLTLLYKADTKWFDVQGCALLADCKIALCQSGSCPTKVNLFNKDGSCEAEIDFSNMFGTQSVSGITSFDRDTLAVSVPSTIRGGSGIKLINHTTRETIKTLPCATSGNICPMGKTGEKIIFIDGSFKSIKISDFGITSIKRCPEHNLYITAFNDKIYYTRRYSHTVTCCDIKGREIWEFKDTSVLVEPCGITVDNKGNIYVVSFQLSRVVFINPDGGEHFVLLTKEDGINLPKDVDCDRETNSLLVANRGGTVFVYKIECE